MNEIPKLSSTKYASGVYTSNAGLWPESATAVNSITDLQVGKVEFGPHDPTSENLARVFQQWQPLADPTAQEIIMANTTNRRIVQVFIADPNENVPLDKSVLYTGPQKLTDLNDTELFFEVPINDLLKTHNAARVTWLDRDATKKAGKDVFLDPVKIRDLKMVVVNIAQF